MRQKKKKKNMQVTVTHNPKGMQKQITRPNRKKNYSDQEEN